MINCSDFREWLLDAELDEIVVMTTSGVASHAVECAACTARRQRILGDTRVLARVIVKSAPVSRRRMTVAVGTALLAASAMLFVRLPRHQAARMGAVAKQPAAVVEVPVVAHEEIAERPKPARRHHVKSAIAESPLIVADASPVAMPKPAQESIVTVQPRATDRVAVLRASNPNVTVVWFY